MRLVSNLQRATTLVAALAAFAAGAQAQTIGCEVGVANGGPIPGSGSGGVGAVFPTTLPATPSVFPLTVAAVPPGATVVTEVKVFGLAHTWSNDVQLVLEDPTGGLHNVFVRAGTATGTGFSCDFGGDYTFVPACTAVTLPLPTSCTGATVLAPGVYDQYFGRSGFAWPSGSAGIFNTPLDSIPAAVGVWNLHAYDWVGGDMGSMVSWDLCFGNPVAPTAPSVAPALTSPADLSVVTNPVTLTWGGVDCATSYDVDLDGVVTNVGATSFAAPVLAPGTHTWTVRAANVSGSGPFATLRSFDVPTPPATAVCVEGGAGGLVPAVGSGGGGTYQTVLPPNPFVSTYIVNVPTGSTQILKIDVNFGTDTAGEHTFAADVQLVLTDPTGGMHNIMVRGGSSCDFNGAYSIRESGVLALGTSATVCSANAGNVPNSAYNQFFNTWVDGTNGIFNTPLSLIPVSSGAWTLTAYDWAGGDDGAITSWSLCFDDAGGPLTYCLPQAPGTTNGCIPTITSTGNPDVAHSNVCVLTVSNTEGDKSGLFLYSVTGQVSAPWCAGGNTFRCIRNPVQRMNVQQSTGTDTMCDGTMTQDWNAYQLGNPTALGSPFGAGDTVDVQGWFRDPFACKTSGMSEAIRLTYTP